jgi:hypothetical protein
LVAEMLNATTAFIVWQAHPTQPITGYEVNLIKGTVSRDFRPSVFFIKQSP